MKNKSITKIIAGALAITSIMAMNPVGANAAWKQNSIGWWYTEGNSWSTGWRLINGNWYYFYSDGYMATKWLNLDGKWYYFYADGSMAKNSWVDGYYVGEDGAMVQYVGFDKMKLSSETDSNLIKYYNKPYRVIDSINTLSIDDENYINKYEGTHILGESSSNNDYIFDLNGKYKSFTTTIGIDDSTRDVVMYGGTAEPDCKITFIVDGNVKKEIVLNRGDKASKIEVDLTGANKLIIRKSVLSQSYGYRYDLINYNIMDGKFYFK